MSNRLYLRASLLPPRHLVVFCHRRSERRATARGGDAAARRPRPVCAAARGGDAAAASARVHAAGKIPPLPLLLPRPRFQTLALCSSPGSMSSASFFRPPTTVVPPPPVPPPHLRLTASGTTGGMQSCRWVCRGRHQLKLIDATPLPPQIAARAVGPRDFTIKILT